MGNTISKGLCLSTLSEGVSTKHNFDIWKKGRKKNPCEIKVVSL